MSDFDFHDAFNHDMMLDAFSNDHDWDYGYSSSRYEPSRAELKKAGKFFFDDFEEKIELATKTTYLGQTGEDYYKISCGENELVHFLKNAERKKTAALPAAMLHKFMFKMFFETHYTEHHIAEAYRRDEPEDGDFVRPQMNNDFLVRNKGKTRSGDQQDIALEKATVLSFSLFSKIFDKDGILNLDTIAWFDRPVGAQRVNADIKDLLGYMTYKLGEGRMFSWRSEGWMKKEQINQVNTRESCKHFMKNAAWFLDQFFMPSNMSKVMERIDEQVNLLPDGQTMNRAAAETYVRLYVYATICTAFYSFFGKGGFASLEEGMVTLIANSNFLKSQRQDDDLTYGNELLHYLAQMLILCQFMPQHLQEQDEKLTYPLKLPARGMFDEEDEAYIHSTVFYLARLAECSEALNFLKRPDRIYYSTDSHLFKLSLLKSIVLYWKEQQTVEALSEFVMALFGTQYSETPRKSSTRIYFSTQPYTVRLDSNKHGWAAHFPDLPQELKLLPECLLVENRPSVSTRYSKKVFDAIKRCKNYEEFYSDCDVVKAFDSIPLAYLYKAIYVSLWLTTGQRHFIGEDYLDKGIMDEILKDMVYTTNAMRKEPNKAAYYTIEKCRRTLFEKVYHGTMNLRKKAYEQLKEKKQSCQYEYEFGSFPNLYDDRHNEIHDVEAAPRRVSSNCVTRSYTIKKMSFKVPNDPKKDVVDYHQPSNCSVM